MDPAPALARRPLGRTGLVVSALGLGCGPLGDAALSEREADDLVGLALELGVTLFDTAPSYGASEARLGDALARRGARAREGAVLVTKGGYGVPGVADWTPQVVAAGARRALEVLRVDALDVFLLHSCDDATLARGDLVEALVRLRDEGLVRAVGYAGDGAALAWAAACPAIDVVECSVSYLDRAALDAAVPAAVARGAGVLGKRALATAPWASAARPVAFDRGLYWDRLAAMGVAAPEPDEAIERLFVRYAVGAPGVAAALAGTRSRAHLEALVRAAASAPLPPAARGDARWAAVGRGWPGVV